ncbi:MULTISPECIES: hypothetical protein [Cyanophyceae]|uniref:hypothetical protein n=1 Tax=Cyanophyceae TaxID=3028117 RepID=UPI00168859ED|nr:hypothetical protein [Trichocoleus sp. FACHB-40]MBD2002756.1 hypothetical protein [Trichocoleus sp. FACHB-40]
MMADSSDVVVAVFGMLRHFCQQAKQAIWALIPREKGRSFGRWQQRANAIA